MVAVALVAAESSFLRDWAIAHSILPRPSVCCVSSFLHRDPHSSTSRLESVSCSFVRYAWKCDASGVNDRSFSVSFVILGLLKERISFEQSGQQDGDEEETVRVRAFSSRVQRAVQCILGFNMRRHVNTNEKRTVDEPTEVEQGAAMSTPVQR